MKNRGGQGDRPAMERATPAISGQVETTGGLAGAWRIRPGKKRRRRKSDMGARRRDRKEQRRRWSSGHGPREAPARGQGHEEGRRSAGKAMVVARGGGGLGFGLI